jgi:hypothetical protein
MITQYYQTVWEDYQKDTDMWDEFIRFSSQETIFSLKIELNTLSEISSTELLKLVNELNPYGGLYFTNSDECKNWILKLQKYIEGLDNKL